MKNDSIRKRYIFTLVSRLIGFFAGFATAGIVPRALGAENYGNYQFVTNAISQLKGMSDCGASSAFFAFSSREQKSGTIVLLYYLWEILQLIFIFAFIAGAFIFGIGSELWPGQSGKMMFAIAGIVSLQILGNLLSSLADSKTLTVFSQIYQLTAQIIQVALIIFIFSLNRLSLNNYILINYFIAFYVLLGLSVYFYNKSSRVFTNDLKKEKIKEILVYFVKYCSPLVTYTIIGFIFGYFNRWFLQLIAGSTEQGYFSLAFNWSQVVLLFTVSMIPIYSREISYAFGQGNLERIKYLFKKFSYMLYSIVAFIAVFTSVFSDFLVNNIAGKKYENAIIPLALALFFPVHQTYGQLCGTLYFATDRTRQYRNIGIALMPFGALVTYILLAPHDYLIPGMGLASIGLAVQLVSVNIISVNILLFLNCRYLKIKYRNFIYHQVFVIFILLTAVIVSRLICNSILTTLSMNKCLAEWILFFSSGILYTTISIIIAYLYPEILGLSRKEMLEYMNGVKKYFSPE